MDGKLMGSAGEGRTYAAPQRGIVDFLRGMFSPQQPVQAEQPMNAQPPGMLGGLQQWNSANPGVLSAIGAGMMQGNPGAGFEQAGKFRALAVANQKQEAEKTRTNVLTRNWLITKKGLSEEDADAALANPAVLQDMMKGNSPDLINAGGGNLYDPATKSWITAPGGGDDRSTGLQREYNQAVSQGFDGSLMDYQLRLKEAGRGTTGAAPSGYRWNEDQTALTAIPGGPATQISADIVGRISLAEDALKQLPNVKQSAERGELTGIVDWADTYTGRGKGGSARRELKAGSEALTRMLTGAGMNMAEAENEAAMYLPRPYDNAATVADKVDQLERRLTVMVENAKRGRGFDEAPAQGGGAPPPICRRRSHEVR